MDWDANLATIIKHTDANLEQQFRQFSDRATDLSTFHSYVPVPEYTSTFSSTLRPPSLQPHQQKETSNFANDFLRESLTSINRPFDRSSTGSNGAATFAQHFRQRQERKRHDSYSKRNSDATASANQKSVDNDLTDGEEECIHEPLPTRRRPVNNQGMGYQMYDSPTYDMAQMMEQVRMSLKLEVDARAAIAERQLSALLQLCKTTSEELDRLRIEVVSNDRQLHSIDQIQSKLRQELTTQKDIGYHLQSMCGKDEAWRIQAENQLLEIRQLVAALREQGNSIQIQVQEKLSRQELLVHFNAAIEPMKAQFQASIQHQAHQLAEITRSSSSSTLLLDTLTQKVNRIQSDEIVELRNELQALKIHVSRMSNMEGSDKSQKNLNQEDDEEIKKRETIQQQQQQTQITELIEQSQTKLLALCKTELESRLTVFKEQTLHDYANKGEMEKLSQLLRDNLEMQQSKAVTSSTRIEDQLTQLQQNVRGDVYSQLRELKEHQELLKSQHETLVETRIAAIHSRFQELSKSIDIEIKENKQTVDVVQEKVRKVRHALDEQLHQLTISSRSKMTEFVDEINQKLRDTDKKFNEMTDKGNRDIQQQIESGITKVKADSTSNMEQVEIKLKAMQDMLVKLEQAHTTMSESVTKHSSVVTESKFLNHGTTTNAVDTQAHLSSLDNLFQKFILQMQLQMQQQQGQIAIQASVPQQYGGYWTPLSPPPTPVSVQIPITPVASQPLRICTADTSSGLSLSHTNLPSNPPTGQSTESQIPKDEKQKTLMSNESVSVPIPAESRLAQSSQQIDDIISRAMTGTFATDSTAQQQQDIAQVQNIQAAPAPEKNSLPAAQLSMPPSVNPSDPLAKIQETLASTTKGAIAEAEMAKLRVEARRKQDMDARQSTTSNPTATLVRSSSTSIITPPSPLAAEKVPVMLRTRSNSVSELPAASPPEAIPAARSEINIPSGGTAESKLPSTASLIPRPVSSASEIKSTPSNSLSSRYPAPINESVQDVPHSKVFHSLQTTSAQPSTPPTPELVSQPTVSHVLCDQCRLPVRSDLLADHMVRQCIKRTINCSKCQVKVMWHELDSHERTCTLSTSDSNKLASSVSTESSEKTTIMKKCRHCNVDVPGNDLFEHELRCDQMLKQCPHCLRRQKLSELQDHIENCDCRLVPCPHECGGKFLQRGIAKHLATRCPKRPATSADNESAASTIVNPITQPATNLTPSSAPQITTIKTETEVKQQLPEKVGFTTHSI